VPFIKSILKKEVITRDDLHKGISRGKKERQRPIKSVFRGEKGPEMFYLKVGPDTFRGHQKILQKDHVDCGCE